MADNTILNPGSGGDVIATDDLGAVKVQRVKVGFGTDGNYADVHAGNPMPVDGAVEIADQPAIDSAISGTAVVGVAGRASATAPAAVDAGDAQYVWLTTAGAVHVVNPPTQALVVAGDVEVQNVVSIEPDGGSLTIDGEVSLATGTVVGVTGALPAGSNLIGKATISAGGNDAVVDSDSALRVVPKSGAVIGGNGTHDSSAPTSVFPVGAIASATAPTVVDAGDSVRLWATTSGALNVADAGGSITVDDGGSTLSVDDGGGSITVDGTVSVNALPTGSNTIGNVGIAGAIPAGTNYIGRVRLTDGTNNATVTAGGSQNVAVTNTVTVQDGGGSITVDGAVTVSGTATVSGSLTSITTSITPGTGASNLGKRVDDASGGTDVGVAAVAVVRNSLSTLPVSDGDYERLHVDPNGALWTKHFGTIKVDSVYDRGTALSSATPVFVVGGLSGDTPSPTSTGEVNHFSLTTDGALRVSLFPSVHDGAAVVSYLSDNSTIAPVVKASPGIVFSIAATNTSAAARYVRVYDKATAATTGDTPIARFAIPGNTSGSGFNIVFPRAIKCVNGIALRFTAAVADNNNTAIPANDVMLNITYA
jgi:hypothetical protein